MTATYGPSTRPDSKPPHPNVIRRFREELRLDRQEFADLLDVNTETLRVWEALKKGSKPRGHAALIIIACAEKNDYPLTAQDIFPPTTTTKKKKKKKAKKKLNNK